MDWPVRHTYWFVVCLLLIASCSSSTYKKKESNEEIIDIIVIMVDDMGYSDLGCFGSEIQTPNIDSLASRGLIVTQFYNNAKCYPSRASLLTGTYPHRGGMGRKLLYADKEKKEVGPFQGWLSDQVVTIPEALKGSRYKSYLAGKWHLGEKPEDWPMQRGFDGYFGLISGASSYFGIIENQKRKRQMALNNQLWFPPDSGFYMTDAITDYAVETINQTSLDSGLFVYVAYTAPHWPLHALEEDIANYDGVYDKGWDEVRNQRFQRMKSMGLLSASAILSPRPEDIPSWEITDDKSDWIRKMQVYAAMIDRMDQGVGLIVNALRKRGKLENALILFMSDNGASAENIDKRGLHNQNVPIGLRGSYKSADKPWANVSNTPFRKYKLELFEGGIRTPLIAHWPTKIQPGQVNTEYVGHLMDLMPTVMEITNTSYPVDRNGKTIEPVDGKSLLPLFENANTKGHDMLYWEYQQEKAVRKGDWKLVKPKKGEWRLYNLFDDPTELNDIASQNLGIVSKLKESYTHWETEMGM